MASEIKDKIDLLELRTKKAVTLINFLRSNNKELETKNSTLNSNIDGLNNQISALTSNMELLTKELDELKSEHAKLKMDYTFSNNRVIELQSYVDDYKDNSKQLEESINKSIETLDAIEGLDDIELLEAQNTELEAADGFTSGDALLGEDLSELDDLEDTLILDDESDLEDLDNLT
jgi:chromosome segregation ATPase